MLSPQQKARSQYPSLPTMPMNTSGGRSPEAESNARENSEVEESLEGTPMDICVCGLKTMLQVSSNKGKARCGRQYGR